MPRRHREHSYDSEEGESSRYTLGGVVVTVLLVGLILIINGLMK
jgi:hypothetical protein